MSTPNRSTVWMESRTLSPGDEMSLTEALDAGEYSTLEVVVTVEQADRGDAAALVFQHAARNVSGAYLDFSPAASVSLTATGQTWVQIDRFTRFLGWAIDGALADGAVVTVDVVAKR